MVRYFPSDDRHRVVALVATLLVVIGMVCAPLAHADGDKDLKDKQRQVKKNLSSAHQDLDESSAALRRANARLQAAHTELKSARAELISTRGQLTTAKVRDRQAQAALDQAELDLADARADLREGQAAVAEKNDDVGAMIADIYEQGDPRLASFSSLLNAEDPTDITRTLASQDALVSDETQALDELKAAKILLGVREENVEDKKDSVATKRAAAAENLELMEDLEAQAASQAASVKKLVGKRSSAKASAAKVKRRDLAELAELRKEQDRIEAMLRARAAAAAKKAGNTGPPGASGGFLSYPVSGPVTSSFGYRVHPIYGYYSLHDGTDFGAGCGQPLYAAADGTVISRYYQTAWGNRLIIDHGHQRGVGLATIYNHATSYTVGVGAHVERGQVVGYVGSTGWSTGCHLHFTVMANGSPVNPMKWL
ncbi:peptidoglycan DD-metalloendopeptidase family protein [Nocardioides sp. JQ2195]|uniref:M23 family metallopeptidase n=1 Tax=Nocardioides sp. JQ2195 TaxID=2592334 RepID=UPI00143E10AA|nr:M23 family metallopeptidase [Nocardioides sp. JQ2195]QIX25980.1 peptidoglycan DD-metalloendopeptidase family protein [Nocardioides sp. JQ2195]